MREIFKEHLKKKSLPLVMAHSNGWVYGRENSLAGVKQALSFKPDIIELDVRKSRDGVLYCHHGIVPIGVFGAQFLGFFSFKRIVRIIGQRETLKEIMQAIPESVDIYLDIKSSRIHSSDLQSIIAGRKNTWVTAYSVRQLKELRKGLGEQFLYAFNRPFTFPGEIARLEGVADMLQLPKWQWKPKKVRAIESRGIAPHVTAWLSTVEERHAKGALSPYKGVFIHYADLSDLSR
jgi:hypothetical protein